MPSQEPHQLDLFAAPDARSGPSPSSLPEGFRYAEEIISASQEQDLLRQIEALPFQEFQFQGFLGNRRVIRTIPKLCARFSYSSPVEFLAADGRRRGKCARRPRIGFGPVQDIGTRVNGARSCAKRTRFARRLG